ncbi:phosphoribosylaminoimidazolesuccinocarboxamide synthase [Thermoflexibacter ruber]|uniref:Phosphoribosylaminoimidazole-succinocarboxamide synthase n=1 Tax=Thermoflexibacter ruber TaxID=1003 RepID=A0A1I2JB55_9BACT|nr:phosphoribosylaminoimidazolesuccinocarboxamide synthase [Thermoflexibacter ruber]SFF49921.1 phosphoribosylaminoimidazole-succinocarboxamide synthase [Thermoflexibacter ruber]
MEAIKETNFHFPQSNQFYKGKVRDVYHFADKLAVVATDRISAFDVVLPRAIPYKGQVLNQIAAHFLKATASIVPNWLEAIPHPNVSIGKKCQPFAVEMVIRGYLSGHAWREYKAGKRTLCGETLPEGLKENDQLPYPIITPTTKAHEGHDEDISESEIIRKKIVSQEDYAILKKYTFALFEKGTVMAKERGLILVDTKYEFGKLGDKIYLIDEVHTPDSSRYFYAEGYEERQAKGEAQKQLSKEFVREWLIANGFQGKEGQQVPEMTDEKVASITARYIELYEQITGSTFQQVSYENILEQIEQSIRTSISI